MSFFDFFKRNKEDKEENSSATQKLANRYLVEPIGYWIPFGRPVRNFKITDMVNNKEFLLNIDYEIFDIANLEKAEAPYYDINDNYYEVTVTVKSSEHIDKPISFSQRLNQKDEEKVIGFKDVDLALYNLLKEARQDSSNPQKQEEAYLVSTLLRAAHDNIWLAPLLIHKSRWESTTPELEKIKTEIKEAQEKAQKKIQAYKEKREERQYYERFSTKKEQKRGNTKSSEEQLQNEKSKYVQALMKENLVDGM